MAKHGKQDTRIRGWAGTLALGTAVLAGPGCFWFEGYDGAIPEGEDVRLDVPGDDGFRAAGERGDVYMLVSDTAQDVNGWVTEVVENVAAVIKVLNEYPETERDGSWRVYGPFNDDEGRDLAWLVKVAGDAEATEYEIYIGSRGARADDMVQLLSGGLEVDGEIRTGKFVIDFDVVEQYPIIKDPEEAGVTYAGQVEVDFERDVGTEKKTVNLQFLGFEAQSFLGEAWFSDETYHYRRADDGSGSFHLAVNGRIDDDAFGGVGVNRVQLDALWQADEAGRARAMVLEVDNEDSALPDGDLIVHECWASSQDLSYRWLNDPYAAQEPSYSFGDEQTCPYTAEEMDAVAE